LILALKINAGDRSTNDRIDYGSKTTWFAGRNTSRVGREFGRTPMQENRDNSDMPFLGRDHHTDAYTIWMAGGGVRNGISYGQTDDIGFAGVEGAVLYTMSMRLCSTFWVLIMRNLLTIFKEGHSD
jgi:hypothetical protein